MSISVCVYQRTGYRFVKATGNYSTAEGQTLADRIHADWLETNCMNYLLDISEVIGNIPKMDRFHLAEYISGLWEHSIRVAVVYRAEEIDKFFENAAVNRGVQVIVVPDVQTAVKWLIGNNPNQPEAGDGK